MPSENHLPAVLTSQELASWLQIPEPEIKKAISQGWLPALVLGERSWVKEEDLSAAFTYHNTLEQPAQLPPAIVVEAQGALPPPSNPPPSERWQEQYNGTRLSGVEYLRGLREAGKYVKRSHTTLYTHIRRGELPGVIRERDSDGFYEWYVPRDSLDIFNLEYNPEPPPGGPGGSQPPEAQPAKSPPSQRSEASINGAKPEKITSLSQLRGKVFSIRGDEQAREILGMSQKGFDAMLLGGRIPYDLAGKTRYYNQQDLEAIKYQLKHDEEESETA